MISRAIVLANGIIEEAALLRARLAGWDGAQVIAADGGSRHAHLLGLRIHAVIGDMDSLEPALRTDLASQGVHFEPSSERKDESDLELALLYAASQGAAHIAVLGALGGRLDMTLANMLVLAHPGLARAQVELWAGGQTAWLIRPPGDELRGKAGDTLSLIPLGGDAQGVTTEALEYPLCDEVLAFGPARGLSNVMLGPVARVSVRAGLLVAVHTPGRA